MLDMAGAPEEGEEDFRAKMHETMKAWASGLRSLSSLRKAKMPKRRQTSGGRSTPLLTPGFVT